LKASAKRDEGNPVKILCRDGQMLETPQILRYTWLVKRSAELRQSAPASERRVWPYLEPLGFLHSHPVAGYICDFFHPELKIDIEIDGPQHHRPDWRLHDRVRARRLEKEGIRTYRFNCWTVYNHLGDVIRQVMDFMDARQPL